MWLLSVKKSDKPGKQSVATYCNCDVKNSCKGTNHTVVHFSKDFSNRDNNNENNKNSKQ